MRWLLSGRPQDTPSPRSPTPSGQTAGRKIRATKMLSRLSRPEPALIRQPFDALDNSKCRLPCPPHITICYQARRGSASSACMRQGAWCAE